MTQERLKRFQVDGDMLTVLYRYDENTQLFIGQFPEFEEEPRYTPGGRPWRNVISTGCPYSAGDYDDCGSCPHLTKADARDIIGVCFHEQMRSRAVLHENEQITLVKEYCRADQ